MQPRAPLATLGLALACSGFGALAVEVFWHRLLARLVGGSTTAATAVLVAYMGGLALGAAIAGRRADALTPARALRVYCLLELFVWLAASALTLALAALPIGLGGALAALPEGAPRFLARLVLSVLVLLLPTAAMGATLPIVVRAVARPSGASLLTSAGTLYAANTAGAVAGALAVPFVLLPAFGVRGGTLVAALASALAAAIASRTKLPSDAAATGFVGDSTDAPDDDASPAVRPAWILLAAATSGAAALGLEILWTRLLGTAGGSSVYAFSTVLALVLAGLAAGSAVVARLGRRVQQPAAACALLLVAGPALAVTLLRLLDTYPVQLMDLAQHGRLTLAAATGHLLLVGAAMILPPAVCFGAALPLAIRAARAGHGDALAVGRVYVANTLGSVTGAAVTGLVLIPAMGPAVAARCLAFVALASSSALVLAGALRSRRSTVLSCALIAMAAFAVATAPGPNPYVSAGASHLRAGNVTATSGAFDTLESAHALYFAEGPEASVLVEARAGERTFFVGGRPEASDDALDVRNQYLLGHLPALLAGGARTSLVVALGSGMTAGALTVHGRVTIAELNRAVPGATHTFDDLNHDVLSHAALRIEDGRMFLAAPGEHYDLITTDPIHPYVAGSSALYTREHFALCAARLNPGGSVSLWLPLHQMGPDELRGIVGAFVDVFPDAELYLTRADGILVGGGLPRTDARRLELFRAGWSPAVAEDMRRSLLGSPEELDALRVAGPAELRALSLGARRNRDDDPWIERTLPRFIYAQTVEPNVRALMALRRGPTTRWTLAHASLQRSYQWEDAGQIERALATVAAGVSDPALMTLEQSARLRELAADVLRRALRAGRREQAVVGVRDELGRPGATLRSLQTLAETATNARAWDLAERAAAALTASWPDRPEGAFVLGQALWTQGRFEASIEPLRRAVALDRYEGYAWYTLSLLGRALVATGHFDEARAAVRRSLALRPDQPDLDVLVSASDADLARLARLAPAIRPSS